MSERQTYPAQRPLIDPERMEAAGRALRRLFSRLAARPPVRDTSIAWEDGEPRDPDDRPAR